MSTETYAAEIAADPVKAAKLREHIRGDLADYAVTLGVINELSAITDSKWHDLYADEARIRQWMGVLGLSLAAGAFSHEAALALLDETDKAHREGVRAMTEGLAYEPGLDTAGGLCPGGCGCRLGTDDADRFECGCDEGCCE